MNIAKRPLPRLPHGDVWSPSMEHFIGLSLERMRFLVRPDPEHPPPRLFPSAEKMRGEFFTVGDWDEFGDLETEHGRTAYLLSCHPERSAPSASESVMQELLNQSSVLAGWRAAVPLLRWQSREASESTLSGQHYGHLNLSRERTAKSDYVVLPRDYEVNEATSHMSRRLWKRSLEEIALNLANGTGPTSGAEFLQIHAFTKDPIYGHEKDFTAQYLLFVRLLTTFLQEMTEQSDSQGLIEHMDLERVAAQAAHESSYLTNPLMDRVFLIHFHAHHQLPYAKIPLHNLAREEFSVPAHVLEVAEEMLLAVVANAGHACPIVPILVTACPSYSEPSGGRRFLTPIIDGNHRATASILLRFLATYQQLLEPFADDAAVEYEVRGATMSRHLVEYCERHHLGEKWQVDLLDVAEELHSPCSRRLHSLILAHAGLVRKFASIESIPALVVQEADFLTICKQRSKGMQRPVLLHPFHQTLFNDPKLGFALPQKAGQTHGRPEGFRLLPLTPFETEAHGGPADIAENTIFRATLRKSMNGLAEIQREVTAP